MAAARVMRNEGPVRTPVRGLLRICDATWTARHLVGVSGQHMPPPSLSDTEEEEEDGSNSSDDFADDPYAHLQRRAAHHGHHNAGVRTGSASRFGAAVLAEEEDDAEGGGAAADLRVDEQDGDDGLGLSPRRRRRSPAGSAGRPAHRQPKFQRTDPCWVTVQDGIMGEEALEVELKKHEDAVAKGRGFTPNGGWRFNKKGSVHVRTWRCLYKHCPAMLRVEKDDREICEIFRSSGANREHNSHQELGLPGISVPGEIRALCDGRLDLPPKKMRSYIRNKLLPDGRPVRVLIHTMHTSIFGDVYFHIWLRTTKSLRTTFS